MNESPEEQSKPVLVKSDAHAVAVGIAIVFLLSCLCFCLAGCSGILSLAAYFMDWSRSILLPLSLLTLLFIGVGTAMWPKGKIRFDRIGPSVIVPASSSKQLEQRPDIPPGQGETNMNPAPLPHEQGEKIGK